MKKHLTIEHEGDLSDRKLLWKKFKEERQKCKNRKIVSSSPNTSFFGVEKSYEKHDVKKQRFIEDLVLYIAKGYEALQKVEDLWMRRLVMRCDLKVVFPTWEQLVEEHIQNMLENTMTWYVLPMIATCAQYQALFSIFGYLVQGSIHLH